MSAEARYTLYGLTLAQLLPTDAAAIVSLQSIMLSALPDPTWYYPSTQMQYESCCMRGECFGYFAANKQLIGFATLTPWHVRPSSCYAYKLGLPPTDSYDVQDVMVHPDFRRRGIHSNLLLLFEEIARTLSGKALYATVSPKNVPSVASFEKAGFLLQTIQPAYEGMPRGYYQKQL